MKKAMDASPALRGRKQLMETFVSGINGIDDVMDGWHSYVAREKEKQLNQSILDEK